MTREEKELLLVDLSGRLSYGVKVQYECWNEETEEYNDVIDVLYSINVSKWINVLKLDEEVYIEGIKPYLFPLSSMTEEQKEEYCSLQQKVIYNSKGLINSDVMEYVNWCYKNHIDINNLIPMGLANDATGLEIYGK